MTEDESSAKAMPAKTLTIDLGEGEAMEMVWVPPGEFWMGSAQSEWEFCEIAGKNHDELRHTVRLTKGFFLGKFPVTQAQWRAVMKTNPSHFKDDPAMPVENLSWEDCQAYLKKLNETSGRNGFRLPTEAEWEYACRAGTETAFYSGEITEPGGLDKNLSPIAWYNRNSRGKSQPAGQKEPNPWGLHDMLGNVWEWLQDWSGPYSEGTAVDPRGPEKGEARVLRGGSWVSNPKFVRAAYRYQYPPKKNAFNFGFRCAMDSAGD